MAIFYIQPAFDAWYVVREDAPTARCSTSIQAVALAMLLVRRSRQRGENARFAGIADEILEQFPETCRAA